jgi:hypothetical protein
MSILWAGVILGGLVAAVAYVYFYVHVSSLLSSRRSAIDCFMVTVTSPIVYAYYQTTDRLPGAQHSASHGFLLVGAVLGLVMCVLIQAHERAPVSAPSRGGR